MTEIGTPDGNIAHLDTFEPCIGALTAAPTTMEA